MCREQLRNVSNEISKDYSEFFKLNSWEQENLSNSSKKSFNIAFSRGTEIINVKHTPRFFLHVKLVLNRKLEIMLLCEINQRRIEARHVMSRELDIKTVINNQQ